MIGPEIDYVEFYAENLEAEQTFQAKAFGWNFIDYGPDYRDIQGAGIGGGIERASRTAPLIVLRAEDLEAALAQVRAAGGRITAEPFDFPGGRRFQFSTPGGTAMAVWSKRAE